MIKINKSKKQIYKLQCFKKDTKISNSNEKKPLCNYSGFLSIY